MSLIPQTAIEQHVRDAAVVLCDEGLGFFVFSGTAQTALANFTDGLMLSSAWTTTGDLLEDALLSPLLSWDERDEWTAPVDALYAVLVDGEPAGDVEITHYGRYWHGYLVFLRPLLCFMGYPQIRSLNMALQLALVTILVCLLVRRRKGHLVPPVLAMWLTLSPATLFWSMQYSTVFYPTLVICIAVVCLHEHLSQLGRCLVFEAAGILVAFFDLLTYPLVSLGVPLVLLLCLEWGSHDSMRSVAVDVVACCLAWVVGYAGMWASKWVIATVLTGEDVIAQALSQASYRVSALGATGEAAAEVTYSRLGVISSNMRHLDSADFTVAFGGILLVGSFLTGRRLADGTARVDVPALIGLGVAFLLPFLWYCALLNHSGVHCGMTYRELAIATYALSSAVWVLVGDDKPVRLHSVDGGVASGEVEAGGELVGEGRHG